MKFLKGTLKVAAVSCILASTAGAALAEDAKPWWPNSADKIVGDKVETYDYTPRLVPPSRKWNICVLLPHLKDTWWVGIAYGAMTEAKRQGVKASLFQAGGYTELNKQLSQFDDCITSGANAILISAISEGALKPKIEQARAKGVKVVAVGNPISGVELDAAVFGDYNVDAGVAGRALVEYLKAHGKDKARVINFAGVAGAGWAEQAVRGWAEAFKGTGVEVVELKYGETGKAEQLKLVEDVAQTYDDIDAYVGVPVMAEVAPDVLDQVGQKDKVVIAAFYLTEGAMQGVKNGDVLGFASNPMTVESAVAMDLAIRVLEGETVPARLRMPPVWIDKTFIENNDMTKFSPPSGWNVTYTVE
ncbi:TMAO reductase system periplasmic protein TorT [Aminobacter sp. Piv2-1]|uniref:TMAO reductase system periplasmic protein TorT n=1 Tax=Aminobacter sp. Piv2-1 TaxID=3031122 RepID=UPI0030AD9E65